MLRRPDQSVVQAQVSAVYLFGFGDMALLEEQSPQGVTRWHHPRPRFRVIQRVVFLNRGSEMIESDGVILILVFGLAIQHFHGHPNDVTGVILKNEALRGDQIKGFFQL